MKSKVEALKTILVERQPVQTTADHRQFGFLQPSSVPSNLPPRASTPRSFQRSIHISEPRNGKLFTTKVVVVRFLESEATLPSILEKVKLAMGNDEMYVLTDSHGNQVMESEGTTGSFYWRQNSRKLHAIEQATFRQWQQRRTSTGRRNEESSGLSDIRDQIEELLEASQGLGDVTRHIKEIAATSRDLTAVHARELKDAFACLVCKGTMENPMFSACCRSLVGCKSMDGNFILLPEVQST
ncbi:unnamed protein product [Leuciscus chuanchicus]